MAFKNFGNFFSQYKIVYFSKFLYKNRALLCKNKMRYGNGGECHINVHIFFCQDQWKSEIRIFWPYLQKVAISRFPGSATLSLLSENATNVEEWNFNNGNIENKKKHFFKFSKKKICAHWKNFGAIKKIWDKFWLEFHKIQRYLRKIFPECKILLGKFWKLIEQRTFWENLRGFQGQAWENLWWKFRCFKKFWRNSRNT